MEAYHFWLLSRKKKPDKIKSLKLLIFFIVYKIYYYKMYCRIESLQETEIDVLKSVKNALIQYSSMLRLMKM